MTFSAEVLVSETSDLVESKRGNNYRQVKLEAAGRERYQLAAFGPNAETAASLQGKKAQVTFEVRQFGRDFTLNIKAISPVKAIEPASSQSDEYGL